ncbi:MAG TPA: histidine phosphatase family protein [Steroidobacteraceae bacterium]|nr:histidine phosphatase family protein [Steroidobacteraceae bacterium]
MGSRRLILLRHGQAQPEDAKTSDFERVLTPRGAHEAAEAGRHLVSAGWKPDLIIVSPAARTLATAVIVAEHCGIDGTLIEAARGLYQASEQAIWRIICACAAAPGAAHVGCLLVCGHNPGLSQLASRLGPRPERRGMPTAGIATALWTHGDWPDLQPEGARRFELFAPQRA